jgi:hypothetical protein
MRSQLLKAAGASAAPLPDVLRDLAVLVGGDLALYLSLEPRGAVMAVKSPEVVAFGKTLSTEWTKASPEARAREVIEWIRSAAAYCRSPRLRWAPSEDEVHLEVQRSDSLSA